MKGIVIGALALTSTAALASNIMPEMTRNRSLSDSALGMSWSKRQVVGATYTNSSNEKMVDSTMTHEYSSMTIAPYIMYSHMNFSGEAYYAKIDDETTTKSTNKVTKDDFSVYDLKLAHRFNEQVALSFQFNKVVVTEEGSTDETTLKKKVVGASFNVGNGFIAGLSYSFDNAEVKGTAYTIDQDTNQLVIGAGYQQWNDKDGYTVELSYSTQGAEYTETSTASLEGAKETAFNLQATFAQGQLELDTEIEKSKDDYEKKKREISSLQAQLNAEYMLSPNFFAAGGYFIGDKEDKETSKTTDSKTKTWTLGAGWRAELWEIEGAYSRNNTERTVSNASTKTEFDGNEISVNFKYNL